MLVSAITSTHKRSKPESVGRGYSSVSTMETAELAVAYGYRAKPSALLNTIFTWTVDTAAKTLVSVASNSRTGNAQKWKLTDHLKFMAMLMTWFTVWVLRFLMDHLPSFLVPSPYYLPGSSSPMGLLDLMPSLPSPSPSSLLSRSSSSSCLDLILYEGSGEPSVKSLERALLHIFTLLNEIPATSRKYQFALAMADRIVDENARDGRAELLHINRTVLASAFARTAGLLYRSLRKQEAEGDDRIGWTSSIIKALPLGSYLVSYVKGLSRCVSIILPSAGMSQAEKRQQLAVGGGEEEVMAEKLAQELLWVMNKLRFCGAVDEVLMQWSSASGLASLSLTSNPRIQGSMVKISAILVAELSQMEFEVPRQVKFMLLGLWLPLFCFAGNGLAFPFLTGYEKAETERALDRVISTLPATDQEIILTNWLQDFTITASDWPNLQVSYDRWCRSTRKLAE